EKARVNRHYPELEKYLATRGHDPARRYIQAEALFDPAELKRLLGSVPDQPVFPADAAPALTGREHPVNAAISFESRCRLPDYVILRLDKLSMRHGLETRTPFLDYRLAGFAARLPVSMKVNPGLNREKLICAYSFVRHGLLDARTAFRKKQPFTFPMADWLSEPRTLPEPIREVVLGNLVQEHNVLDPGFVRRLSENVTAAGVGPQTLVSGADRLFSVIVFTLWYQHFMRDYQNFRIRGEN
ncbi:MAG: asparagine synthase-related protein, partial [Desulfosalsimonas sp.]